jgi:hypothetical protein
LQPVEFWRTELQIRAPDIYLINVQHQPCWGRTEAGSVRLKKDTAWSPWTSYNSIGPAIMSRPSAPQGRVQAGGRARPDVER